MGWTEKITEGLRGLGGTSFARELMESAKAKAEKGLDQLLHGRRDEGERLVEEAKEEAMRAGMASSDEEAQATSERPEDSAPTAPKDLH